MICNNYVDMLFMVESIVFLLRRAFFVSFSRSLFWIRCCCCSAKESAC